MSPSRRIALYTGVLFIITFITSIPALLLYDPVLNDVNYILGAGSDNRIFLGVVLELILIIANIGSAVVPYPLLKRQHGGAAIGYVTARVVECVFIGVGILAVLSVVTLRQDVGGVGAASSESLAIAGRSLVAIKDWTFLLGPGFVVGIGNGFLLGYLMYRSRLMPRRLAMLGLIGGPMLCVSAVFVIFDVFEAGSAWQFLMTIPEILWELSIGLYLTFKGFTPSRIADEYDRDEADGFVQGLGSQPA